MDIISRPIEDFSSPHKRIWRIAGPAILANSTAPIVGLVDVWAIGHIPDVSNLAAVGLGGTIFTYIFWAFGFLRMGTTGLVAQAAGLGARDVVVSQAGRSIILGLIFASLLLLFQMPILKLSFLALGPPEGVAFIGEQYFNIRILAAPATLFIYSVNGVLFGLGRAKEALILQLILNLTNVGLNLLFVVGMDMGVKGVALGTLIAEWGAAILGVYFLVKILGFKQLQESFCSSQLFHFNEFQKIMILNGFIFVRTLLLMTAFVIVMRVAGSIGEAEMAASHVMMQFNLLMSLGLDGFAHAGEALAGGAYGMKRKLFFMKWVYLTSLWALIASGFYSLFFFYFGADITTFLTDIDSVRKNVGANLWVITLLPIVAVWSFLFDGIFIGATQGKAMMITMALSFGVYLFSLSIFTPHGGLEGLWIAVLIFLGSRGLFQATYMPFLLKKLKN